MFSKLRSLIFKIDPETAHNLAIKSLKFNFINNVFDENKNDNIFTTTLFGKKIENPIGIAAGFDKNAEVYNSLFRLGFGFVEVGTVTPLKQYGNSKPRVFRLEEDEALINRLGFNNSGADKVSYRIKSHPPKGLLGIKKKYGETAAKEQLELAIASEWQSILLKNHENFSVSKKPTWNPEPTAGHPAQRVFTASRGFD